MIQATAPLLLLQQLGPAGRLASDMANHPELVQGAARDATQLMAQQQMEQVQKTDESNAFSGVKDRKKGNGGGSRQQRRHGQKPAQEEELPPSLDDLSMGLLLNYRI